MPKTDPHESLRLAIFKATHEQTLPSDSPLKIQFSRPAIIRTANWSNSVRIEQGNFICQIQRPFSRDPVTLILGQAKNTRKSKTKLDPSDVMADFEMAWQAHYPPELRIFLEAIFTRSAEIMAKTA